jgi:hypothetical protein
LKLKALVKPITPKTRFKLMLLSDENLN